MRCQLEILNSRGDIVTCRLPYHYVAIFSKHPNKAGEIPLPCIPVYGSAVHCLRPEGLNLDEDLFNDLQVCTKDAGSGVYSLCPCLSAESSHWVQLRFHQWLLQLECSGLSLHGGWQSETSCHRSVNCCQYPIIPAAPVSEQLEVVKQHM